jgi:hypothetical protein
VANKGPKRLTYRQAHAIASKPLPPVCHYRICHSFKRWAGVMINDGLGGDKKPAGRLPGMTGDDTDPNAVITQYDSSFYLADVALWERIEAE